MSTYVERLATELRNRFDDHDRVGFEAALTRMLANLTYAGPTPQIIQDWNAPGPMTARPHGSVEGDYCPLDRERR